MYSGIRSQALLRIEEREEKKNAKHYCGTIQGKRDSFMM